LRAGVKIIFHNNDGSIEATALYRLGGIECQKDTAKLLALTFTPRLNAALKQIVRYKRSKNRKLVLRDGSLAVYKKNNIQGADCKKEERKTEARERNPQGAEGKAQSIGNLNQGAEGKALTDVVEQSSTFYGILDRTDRSGDEDTLVLNVPIRVFITGHLAYLTPLW
jgi:hypothetical protein